MVEKDRMDKIVEAIILSHLPKAKKIEDGDKGSCKIFLPRPLKEMEECEALRRALTHSHAKPTCLKCHSHNTRFRYFNNSSSKSLQARYKCLTCNQLFTFGGKQYIKHHNASTIQSKSQTSSILREASSDDHAMAGKERECPLQFIREEDELFQNLADWAGQHNPTEDHDSFTGLQLCLHPPQAFTY